MSYYVGRCLSSVCVVSCRLLLVVVGIECCMLACIVACLLLLFRVAVGGDGCRRCCLRCCSLSAVVYVCWLRLYSVGFCCCCCAVLFIDCCCVLLLGVCCLPANNIVC